MVGWLPSECHINASAREPADGGVCLTRARTNPGVTGLLLTRSGVLLLTRSGLALDRYLMRVFFDYSLCCLWRSKKPAEVHMGCLTPRGESKDYMDYQAVKSEYF